MVYGRPIAPPPASPNMPKINLLNLTPAAAHATLEAFFRDRGEPLYRARQVSRRLWQAPVKSFSEITDLPVATREALEQSFELPSLVVSTEQLSADGTRKFLFRLADGEAIETVAIPDADRLTLCISSQAGCALHCAFCATGKMGFTRNLEPYEIAGQVREMALLDPPITVTNIVFMGMGEPLMNWQAVDVALTILNDPNGLGHRRTPHHGLDGRHSSRHRRARRAAGTVPTRDLDPRAER